MIRRSVKSWSCCRGLTLIEVVAAMTLLGTLLVAVVMTTGKLTASSHLATKRVEAYRAADKLITGWWGDTENFPKNDSGKVEGHEMWQWKTSTVEAEIKNVDAELVTLEIVETDKEAEPLARVEFLLKKITKDNDKNEDETNSETQPTTQPATGPDAG